MRGEGGKGGGDGPDEALDGGPAGIDDVLGGGGGAAGGGADGRGREEEEGEGR